jgi:SAM-dependent methyltransferase
MMNDMGLEIDPRNAGVLREWDGEHGSYWAEHAATYNASVTRYQSGLMAAIGAQPGERILDVGCGSGELAIDLVRSTPGTTALGVDLSTAQLEVARHQAGELPVKFEQADAQVQDFGAQAFDVIASRTGTMFFTDMAMAFANLAKATRPGGRLVMLVWRGIEENEWLREIFGAIGRVLPMSPPPADAPGPFSLSDPDRVRELLQGAGWTDISFTPKDELMGFGPDANTATTFTIGQMKWLFDKLDDDGKRQAEANLHEVMAAHASKDGVHLGSGAWIVTARRTRG